MDPHVVRSISLVRHGPLIELQLDQGERLRVHQRRVAATSLRVGTELGECELAALRRDAEVDRCEQRALRLLTVRGRSSAELDQRLRRWGLDEDESSSVVERLQRLGLVDDVALAGQTAATLAERGHGHLRVAHDLDRLAVPDGSREDVVRDHALSDLERARRVAEQRFGPRPYELDVQRRAAGLLARRGFDADTVIEALGVEP